MEIRRASPGDYAEVIDLQAANFLFNLAAEDREGGFLSAQFTLPQFVAMADDLGVLVAKDADHVVGYVCAHRIDLPRLPPLVDAMVRCCRAASYRGALLAHARLFVYGPVCIARAHRGRGVLRELYRAVLAEMAGRFEVGVTLVSDDNPHSLQAHVEGLGMDDVARFEHGGRLYHLLAFAVR
jgi:Acetyltransferase (GNAT) family